jgi:hypothetical protein
MTAQELIDILKEHPESDVFMEFVDDYNDTVTVPVGTVYHVAARFCIVEE